MKFIGRVWRKILDFLFPPHCVSCGKEGSFFCKKCASEIIILNEQVCPVCGKMAKKGMTHTLCKEKTRLDGLLVLASYKQNKGLKKAITKFKYASIKNTAEVLGGMLGKLLYQEGLGEVVIVPVPLYYRRQWWRGFNQADELAKNLGEKYEIRHALKRTRYTKPQVSMGSREDRLKNMEGVFQCVKALDPSKVYVVLDDVSTTRATLEDAARALKAGGAKKVYGLVLARG